METRKTRHIPYTEVIGETTYRIELLTNDSIIYNTKHIYDDPQNGLIKLLNSCC